jgi:hypothetical protein
MRKRVVYNVDFVFIAGKKELGLCNGERRCRQEGHDVCIMARRSPLKVLVMGWPSRVRPFENALIHEVQRAYLACPWQVNQPEVVSEPSGFAASFHCSSKGFEIKTTHAFPVGPFAHHLVEESRFVFIGARESSSP